MANELNNNVGAKSVANKGPAIAADPAQQMLDALKSGDVDAAMGAMQNLLNAKGGRVQGDRKQPGFADKLKAGLENVRGSLSEAESAACDSTLKAASKPPTSNAASTANTAAPAPAPPEKPAVDANATSSARRHAATAERARQAALLTRVDVENAGNYVGTWNPQVAEKTIGELNARQSLLETERANVGAAMKELGGEIDALKASKSRSQGDDINLQAKEGQLQSFEMLDKVLGGRIDQMKAAKGALKFDNFNNENKGGQPEISRDEAVEIANHGNIIDKELVAAATLGRNADSLAIRAEDLANKTRPATSNPTANAGNTPSNPTANANATANTNATANANATNNAAAKKPVVEVKDGQWLSRIAASSKNADGSAVTLDQLRQQPENKFIFDRAASGDVLKVGDKVTLPAGATFADSSLDPNAANNNRTTTPSNAAEAPSTTRPVQSGPRKGLSKEAPATNPTANPTANAPATTATTATNPTANANVTSNTSATNNATFAKLSDRQVNDAVTQISQGVGATKGGMNDVNKVFDAVTGMAPNQIQQVKDAYNAKFGKQGWDFDKNVTAAMYPWNQRAMQALEKGDQKQFDTLRADGKKLDAQVRSDSDALFRAVDGGGTDENAVFSVLKKNAGNKELIGAVERDYQARHGEKLRDRLDSELGSGDFGEARNTTDDVTRARALMNGDTNTASAALLHSLLADGSRNIDVAMQVMTKEIEPSRRKAVAEAFQKQYGVSVDDMVAAVPFMGTDQKARMIRAAKDMAK